jgi:hypothetical protein
MPGSANDISVLDASLVFTNMMSGVAPKCEYTIKGHQYNQGYFLAGGIYPDYSTLVKTILQPQGLERKVQNVIFIALIEFDADGLSSILQRCKRQLARMWNARLEFSRHDLQLWHDRH